MGAKVSFAGGGPCVEIHDNLEAIGRLIVPDPQEHMSFVLRAIELLVAEAGDKLPVLGFAGAPFTLAAYMIEGKGSASFNQLREMLYQAPDVYHALAKKLAATVTSHLAAQLEAGASMVQLFDTWAGLLSAEEYRKFALPYTQSIFRELAKYRQQGSALSLFVRNNAHLLDVLREVPADIISLDWRVDIGDAKKQIRR